MGAARIFVAIVAVSAAGCLYVQTPTQPTPPVPAHVTTWSPLGGVSVNYSMCAGQATLIGGTASVTDPCFTDTANVVICTDNTAPNPVRCTGEAGSLYLHGTGSDVISWTRIK